MSNETKPTRVGTVLAKGNKTDCESQRFSVEEIDGESYYYNRSISAWCSIPSAWIESIVWEQQTLGVTIAGPQIGLMENCDVSKTCRNSK